MNNQYHEELLRNQETENIVEKTSVDNEISFSEEVINNLDTQHETTSNLREFGVDTDEPDLFSSENQNSNPENLLGSTEDEIEEDDLEIPAFLRRQKN